MEACVVVRCVCRAVFVVVKLVIVRYQCFYSLFIFVVGMGFALGFWFSVLGFCLVQYIFFFCFPLFLSVSWLRGPCYIVVLLNFIILLFLIFDYLLGFPCWETVFIFIILLNGIPYLWISLTFYIWLNLRKVFHLILILEYRALDTFFA